MGVNKNIAINIAAAKKVDEKGEGGTDEKKLDGTEKKEDPSKDADTRSTKSTSKKPESERGKRDDNKRIKTWDHHRSHSRSRSRERRRRDDVLTFAKIRVRYFCVAPSCHFAWFSETKRSFVSEQKQYPFYFP